MRTVALLVGRAALIVLGSAVLTYLLLTVGMFDAAKIVSALTHGHSDDPVSQLAYTFRMLGDMDRYVVTPLVCLGVGVFVGLIAGRGLHFIALISALPLLYFRVTADTGADHMLLAFLLIGYIVLTVLTSHFVAKYRGRMEAAEHATAGDEAKASRRGKSQRQKMRA